MMTKQYCQIGFDRRIKTQANHGWREAHGPHFCFTRDHSATLPSQWAQQVLGHNLLLGLSSQLDIDLSRACPVSSRSIQRPFLQTAAAIPRVLRPTFALQLFSIRPIWLQNLRLLSAVCPSPSLFS
jgi:hypothetical protein